MSMRWLGGQQEMHKPPCRGQGGSSCSRSSLTVSSPFLSPFVPQFSPVTPAQSRNGKQDMEGGHILSTCPSHLPVSPAPTHASSTSPSSHRWGSSWPLSS